MSVALSGTKEQYRPPEVNNEVAQFDDTTTWLAEALNGNMRTSFDYIFDGNDLLSERDGRAMGEVLQKSLDWANELVRWNPNFSFELRRREIEKQEYDQMIEMAANPESPNTMIVVSDFPQELVGASKDVGGYNTTRQQTMLRVITRGSDGKITMVSQSLDKSDRDGLEAIYHRFGMQPQRGELLGQRISLNIDEKLHASLSDNLTRIYDNKLNQKFGGEWYAGRSPIDYRNTYDFAVKQTDLIDVFLASLRDESEMRKLIATVEARYEGKKKFSVGTVNGLRFISAAAEMEYYGRQAKQLGKTYSGCGMTIGGIEEEMSGLGYGDSDKKNDQDCEFVSKSCPECGTKNVKTKVTKTHTSGSCGCKVKNS